APVGQALADAQTALDARIAAVLLTPEATPDTRPLVVASPQAPNTAAATETTIRFASYWIHPSTLQPVVEAFQQQHPEIAVEVVELETPDGELSPMIDCFVEYGPLEQAAIAEALDLQPLIDADAAFALDDYPPVLLESYRSGAGLHGLPLAVQLPLLNYNQTAFAAAGLAAPNRDWSIDDFRTAAQQLTDPSGPDPRYGYAVPVSHVADIWLFLDSFGASLVEREGTTLVPTFTDARVVAALRNYLDVLLSTSPNREIFGYQRDRPNSVDPYNLIFLGRVGMWLADNPGVLGLGDQDFTTAVAPLPQGSGVLTAPAARMHGLYISAASRQPQACWTWLKHLSNRAGVSFLRSRFPARMSLVESEAFLSNVQPGAAEVFAAFVAALDQQTTPRASLDDDTMDYYWFFRAVDRALQGADLEQELAAAQQITEDFLICVDNGGAAGQCATQVDPDYRGLKQ
ncbi:MAG: extracellular solute-binding protein, partial [Chloroflexales bacterium]|nr:extracellular solute-binding protein [Chloroflexales bacterium]